MASRDEIITHLDSYLEKDKFTDYLPIGLLVEGRPEIKRVATAVSACVEVFDAAAEWGADMILVHHGMFWKNADPVLRGHLKTRVKRLLDHDITLAGYHLPLDAHATVGNNALFIRAMELTDPQPFGLYHGKKIGWRGACEPTPINDFVERAAAYYGNAPTTALLHGKPYIKSVAVISGGAWEHVTEAALEGVDCFVTGNADEPAYHLAREEGIHFLAFGHHATERVGVRRLGEVLAERFDIEARFFDVDNPL